MDGVRERLGMPLIADEIQSGFFRTGRFLRCEHLALQPDYIPLGKSLGGGLAKISSTCIAADRYVPEFGWMHRSTFTTAAALITTLGKAVYENRLEERLKILTRPKPLIIDEIGYIPIDRQGANLFFPLVSRRCERGAILLTSNQSLGAPGEVFGDAVIASAILDRLLRHATTINI